MLKYILENERDAANASNKKVFFLLWPETVINSDTP